MVLLKADYEAAEPGSHKAGPHGYGHPEDKTLTQMEAEVLVMNVVRDRAKTLKCLHEWRALGECSDQHGFMMISRCQEQNKQVRECMGKWFHDVDFQRECMNIYLDRRTHYRATGVPREDAVFKKK